MGVGIRAALGRWSSAAAPPPPPLPTVQEEQLVANGSSATLSYLHRYAALVSYTRDTDSCLMLVCLLLATVGVPHDTDSKDTSKDHNATFDSLEEEEEVQQQGFGDEEFVKEHDINHYQVDLEDQQKEEKQVEYQHQEEQHQDEQQVEYQHQDEQIVEEQFEHQVEHQIQPNVPRKLPVVRAAMQDKGKEIQDISAHEGEDGEDSSNSDYDDVHEADSGDSSADDEEAYCYRKQAQELKKRVKRKMLGEDELKATKVPEEFIVLENVKEEQEDGSDCFDTEHELSYDKDSDGNVRTRKTQHRVYDETADVEELEVGQAFHDSKQFKQAVVNYGLKNSNT
ncbi:hypothetical protein ACQ4PT_035999 [Festuca glaucescens]